MRKSLSTGTILIAVAGTALSWSATASATPSGDADTHPSGYAARVVLSGSSLSHDVNGQSEPLSKPDDIVVLDGKLFVGFQNGVGPQGEPSSTGNTASTLVEMSRGGQVIHQWDFTGKIDGLGADPIRDVVAATVNEDGNSSVDTVRLGDSGHVQLTHYLYDQNPLPHGGGTDAITFMNGLMLVSASAPSSATGPAVYAVTLHPPVSPGGDGVASTSTVFSDNATATPANQGAPSQLALTDPDSNTAVPKSADRFGGDFMLDSQGDQQQVYVDDPGSKGQKLSVLQLSQSVNDTSFVTSADGTLFVTDASADSVDAVKGPFDVGDAFTAVTPCGSNSAPATCPAPGFPANYLGIINLDSGNVSPVKVSGTTVTPQGLAFFNVGEQRGHGTDR